MLQFKRIYVRRYSDSGQVVAYADDARKDRYPTKARVDHALFSAARRQGLRLERETW